MFIFLEPAPLGQAPGMFLLSLFPVHLGDRLVVGRRTLTPST